MIPKRDVDSGVHHSIQPTRSDPKQLAQFLETQTQMIDQLHQAFISLDVSGTIVSWNQGAQHRFGYQPTEIIQKNFRRLFRNPSFNVSQDILQPFLTKGQHEFEAEMLTKEEEYFPAHISLSRVKNDQGEMIGILGLLIDLTEQKRAEAKLRQKLNQEREQKEQLTNFISIVSHEYRNPLSSILSSTDLLEYYAHSCTESEKQDFFKQIRAAVQQMTDLLNDVLITEQSKVNFLAFKPAPLDLGKFCIALTKELQQPIQTNHHIQLLLDDEPIHGVMDHELLRHILSNLISNAVKYTPQGGTIKLKLVNQDPIVIFSVQDPGIGIPDHAKHQLFQSFYRADNVGDITGTGVGLAIVKQLVDIHQGQITVDSQLNVGTIVTLTLPLYPPKDSHEA